MRYREALTDVASQIVLEKILPTVDEVCGLGERVIELCDVPSFVELATQELRRLNERNIARYRLRRPEYWAWHRAMHTTNVTR